MTSSSSIDSLLLVFTISALCLPHFSLWGEMGRNIGSVRSIFMHADAADYCLMAFGLLGAISAGLYRPTLLFVVNKIMNNIGSASTSGDAFSHKINQVFFFLLILFNYSYLIFKLI